MRARVLVSIVDGFLVSLVEGFSSSLISLIVVSTASLNIYAGGFVASMGSSMGVFVHLN